MLENCYFYTTKKDNDTYVVALCMECRKNNKELGWFWEGSVKGYGPFVFKCEKCEKLIYEPEETETSV